MIAQHLITADVATAVQHGLSQSPKALPSWLFYDATGDKIFQQIMKMPSYYLTRCEYEILTFHKESLFNMIAKNSSKFKLVEFGPGDGKKTQVLLAYFLSQGTEFSYHPVDISRSALFNLQDSLAKTLPTLQVEPLQKRYEEAVHSFLDDNRKHVYLFLGANIGNFSPYKALRFVQRIASHMREGDQIIIGFDLKKDPRLVQAAYDDPFGITRDFNMNLLTRLNRELGANFLLDKFSHFPSYDPESGTAKSYLISLAKQAVHFESCDMTFHFERSEPIHTEISQKYDKKMIEDLAHQSGLEIVRDLYDCKHYFCDVVFQKTG